MKFLTSGGISADFGMPGESMACLPSATTSFTSSTFFLFLPSVPILFQKVSSPDCASYLHIDTYSNAKDFINLLSVPSVPATWFRPPFLLSAASTGST